MSEYEVTQDNETLDTNLSKEIDLSAEAQAAAEEGPRRSQRTRKLTDAKSRNLQHRFMINYEKWKALAKEAKNALQGSPSSEILQDLMNKIRYASTDVKGVYEDLRQHMVPDGEILDYAWNHLEEKDKGQDLHKEQARWADNSSVFSSSTSQRLSASINSRRSSLSSTKKQEAAAELAATEATLKVLEEMELEKQELESLEAENRQRFALQEAENATRKKALEEKRRQIERLETVKKMNAAKARLQVYKQEIGSDEEISELLHDCKPMQEKSALNPGSLAVHHAVPPQGAAPVQPVVMAQTATRGQPSVNVHQEDSTTALAKAIVESINASQLLVPEPSVFSGDPLRYKDWKMSFQTLIDRKNIPVSEKVYYLCKYVSGPARKAIESYFLLGTDAAYYAAWDILEERYGSSFVIAKAFTDKLTAWPKIGPKDSNELREFSDMSSCNVSD